MYCRSQTQSVVSRPEEHTKSLVSLWCEYSKMIWGDAPENTTYLKVPPRAWQRTESSEQLSSVRRELIKVKAASSKQGIQYHNSEENNHLMQASLQSNGTTYCILTYNTHFVFQKTAVGYWSVHYMWGNTVKIVCAAYQVKAKVKSAHNPQGAEQKEGSVP